MHYRFPLIEALRECDATTPEIVEVYRKRRDALIKGLNSAGWNVPAPIRSFLHGESDWMEAAGGAKS